MKNLTISMDSQYHHNRSRSSKMDFLIYTLLFTGFFLIYAVVFKRALHTSLKLSSYLASREQKSISSKIIRYLMIYVSIYFF